MLSHVFLDVLDRLPNLNFLEYRNIIYYPEDGASDHIAPPTPSGNTAFALTFTPSLHNRLHALSLDAVWVDRIPVWVYNQLTVLEVSSENYEDPINLDFICHHCPILEELSITGDVLITVCLSLPREPTFPKLQSLRLSCEMMGELPDDEHIETVSRFIQSHSNLRRLYLRFPDAAWFNIETLLADIRGLQRLEVLGLHTGADDLDEETLEMLLAYLPMSLKALQLAMSWNSSSGNHVPILVSQPSLINTRNIADSSRLQMNTLSGMSGLKFLHIYGTYMRLPLSAEELAMELKSLTMVGLTRALWDIDRTGPEIEVLKWPRWKVKFFAESDFHDPDDAWLFKYH